MEKWHSGFEEPSLSFSAFITLRWFGRGSRIYKEIHSTQVDFLEAHSKPAVFNSRR